MRINDIIFETTSGSIGGVAGPLGSGDPSASVYYNQTPNKKNKKTNMIKRPQMETKNDSKSSS